MRTSRQHTLDRAVIRILLQVANFSLPEVELLDGIARATTPRALLSEAEETVRWQESHRRILGLRTETGVKWKITDEGRAYAAEHGLG